MNFQNTESFFSNGHYVTVTYTPKEDGYATLNKVDFYELPDDFVSKLVAHAEGHIESLIEDIGQQIGFDIDNNASDVYWLGHREGS